MGERFFGLGVFSGLREIAVTVTDWTEGKSRGDKGR
jgi:hypothetical protein